MGTTDARPATLTVPADYLEDARAALATEMADAGDALKNDPAEFESSARILARDMELIEQLVDAAGEPEPSACTTS